MPKNDVIDEKSMNDINYELLKKLFPHAVSVDTEGKYAIDPQKLQLSLDPSVANIKEDGYGLSWVGKKEAYHKAFSKNYKVLKPLNDDNSVDWDNTQNVLIKGDNLDALKILRHSYFESIKMIYIDPPYNTKNDNFVYNDNFTSSTQETLEELGYETEYIDYIENIQGAKTHSGWLSFMYPRLLLARDLLKEDGVIFISIDDNEVAQLKLLCDEVFGGDNFVGQMPWKKRTAKSDVPFGVSQDYEWILIYAKDTFQAGLLHGRKYYETSDFENDRWRLSDLTTPKTPEERQNSVFDMIDPKTGKIYPCGKKRVWGVTKDTFDDYYQKGKIVFPDDYGFLNISTPAFRVFESEDQEKALKKYGSVVGIKAASTFLPKEVGMTKDGNKDMVEIFNTLLFSNPKPVSLVKHLVKMLNDKDSIILDFFTGSGTTAHAIMELNAQDGGHRKYICVQWAEPTPPKSEARKAGYETIFDITQERIKRAGQKLVDGDLTQQELDIGFRTFEVVEDIKQKIYQKSLEGATQDDLLVFGENTVESTEDILYNLLVAEALPLSTKIETLIADKLYMAENVAFVLGDVSIDEMITELKGKKELEYITIYSPNISSDKFTLELESAIGSLGIKPDKLRFRG